jgi:hypothetical protein
MNKKLSISLCFIFLISILSGYCLWQIDRHEKAILGREWLNPVPVMTWRKYLREKEEFDNLAKSYINNNQDIIAFVQDYQSRQKTLDEIFESLPPAPGMQPKRTPDEIMGPFGNSGYLNAQPNPDDILEHIRYDTNIPNQLFLPKSRQLLFKHEHPSEFNTWQAMIDDLRQHEYETPHPSNPPYLVIRQSISSYYRYMFVGDGILILGLVVFLLTYKEKAIKTNI